MQERRGESDRRFGGSSGAAGSEADRRRSCQVAPRARDEPEQQQLRQRSTTSVIANRIRPRSISDDVYVSPTASVNSLARVEAMVLPGINSEGLDGVGVADDEGDGHRLAERRPSPSMMPPITRCA